MVLDTDVLVWFLRGKRKAAALIESLGERRLSVINYMELVRGARNKRELLNLKELLARIDAVVLPLSENIGHRAAIYVEEYGLASGLHLADALVAATAIENRLPLCTGNKKHYSAVKDLEIRAFRP